MTKRQLKSHLRQVLEAYVPGIANRCGLPARGFTLVWSDTGAAACDAAAGVIFIGEKWLASHPEDYGALVHEYVHLIQNVPGGTCPGEVIEGAADAMRYIFGLFDPGWWSPSPMALRISRLSWEDLRRLSRAMAAGAYDPALLVG